MRKTIFSNTLAQLVAKFVGAGLTLITTILIIRLAGPTLFGDLTKALVLIAVAFTAIDFGLNAVVVRSLGGAARPQSLMADLLGLRLTLSLIALALINLLVVILPGGYTPAIKSVFWLGSLAIVFQGIFTSINAWFQYQENYWSSAWATMMGALVGTALTLYAIFTAPTLTAFLLANTLGYLTMAVVSLYLGRAVLQWRFQPAHMLILLRRSLLLGAILLASILASKLDTILLGIFRSSSEVGQYGFSYRIFDVILVLPVFVMNAIYPKLVKETAAKTHKIMSQSLRLLGILGVMAALFVWFLAPFILLIRPGLTLSVTSLRLLSLSLPFFFLTAPLMWQQISRSQEHTVLKIYLLAALCNGVLNGLFIPHYGVVAAALVTGLTELFILISLVYSSPHETTT